MFYKSVIMGAISLLSIRTIAATEVYYYPEYNSGEFIQHVELDKTGPRYYMEPEQPIVPQLDIDQVLVGIGVRAGETTVTTVRLDYRAIDQYGGLSEIRSSYFGSKPSHELECEYIIPEKAAIVGLAFRINGSDDFRYMQVKYRKITDDGVLLGQIHVGYGYDYNADRSCNDYGTHIEAQVAPDGDKVITGVGLVNDDEDVDSLWIYRGNYVRKP